MDNYMNSEVVLPSGLFKILKALKDTGRYDYEPTLYKKTGKYEEPSLTPRRINYLTKEEIQERTGLTRPYVIKLIRNDFPDFFEVHATAEDWTIRIGLSLLGYQMWNAHRNFKRQKHKMNSRSYVVANGKSFRLQ